MKDIYDLFVLYKKKRRKFRFGYVRAAPQTEYRPYMKQIVLHYKLMVNNR
jgi:hypothetical protein